MKMSGQKRRFRKPENKNELRKSRNMPFIWGLMGGVNEKFLSILSKNSSSKLENGKGRSSGVPLLDVHGVSYFLVGKQCKQRQ